MLGLGVTGQLHVQLAQGTRRDGDWGDAKCRQRALAETLGADMTVPGDADAVAKVREATEGRGPMSSSRRPAW